jgi:hypothetical protein
MQINLLYDANALAAPQSFRDAIQAAANILDSTFVDNIAINIAIGYGELTLDGSTTTLTKGSAAAGPENYDIRSYSTVRSALLNSAAPGVISAVRALPTGFAFQGHSWIQVWSAEEKALGLTASDPGIVDGAAGFATNIPTRLLVGVALHELTHAMGRVPDSMPDIFEFYRFTSPGVRLIDGDSSAPAAYFSLDNGATHLADYGQTSDSSDFLNGLRTPNDPLNEFYNASTIQSLTQADILQMEALGFHASGGVITQSSASQAPLRLGPADVVFRNGSTGDWGYMTASAGSEAWHGIGGSSTAYDAQGVGDFDRDGGLDVAFRQHNTGDWGYMSVNPGGGETWHAVGPTSTAYAQIAIADFDGDGGADIAFRNTTTGDMGFMSASSSGGEIWHAVGPTSTAYAALGAADFNNDGVTDIAFRNVATGDWGYMTVNPSGDETWHAVGPTSTAYAFIGVGAFASDGVPHVQSGNTMEAEWGFADTSAGVAFRNIATGDWGYMTVDASGGETWHPVGATSTAYQAIQVADFDGSGLSDIAFRNPATGDWGYMSVHPAGGETWHAVGPTSTDYFVIV